MDTRQVIGMSSAIGPTRTRSPRILMLGGTSEASELAARLASRTDLQVITSLAGRVSNPKLPAGLVRVGGFGGVDGLIAYLIDQAIEIVIDATHPFASKISRNAELACNALHLPLIAFERPPWAPQPGDRWWHVPDVEAAAALADQKGKRVFLSIGRQEVGAFSGCRHAWFLVRAIDEPRESLPPNSKVVLARGPFQLENELRTLREECIDIIVSKNSGGLATYPKLEAARELCIPVVMIDRPAKHTVTTVASPEEVLLKISELL